jgi:hypothetical protein
VIFFTRKRAEAKHVSKNNYTGCAAVPVVYFYYRIVSESEELQELLINALEK